VHFVDVVIRQAHPGPALPPYHSFAHKMHDAEAFKHAGGIPYTMLVDDLPGTVHQVYGGLPDPTYVIDAEGRVSSYNMWTHAPTLYEAIEALFEQGGRGTVLGGYDRTPPLLATIADGWNGLRRGWPQSVIELEASAPGMASGPWLGYQLRPLLAPLALRSKPLPAAAKMGLAVGAVALLLFGVRCLVRSGLRKAREDGRADEHLGQAIQGLGRDEESCVPR
jgi:hypothetical protein